MRLTLLVYGDPDMIAHPPGQTRPRARRTAILPRACAALAAVTAVTFATSAVSAAATGEAHGGDVGTIEADRLTGLAEGDVITVRGTGFDTAHGIYVAVCVDNGPGQKPSPCLGGADVEGTGGAVWISDTPPSYAEGLTVPYGPDGTFEVTLTAVETDPVTGVDCREQPCAVTTRYDHLRGEDRGADHVLPVAFGSGPAAPDQHPADEEPTAEDAPEEEVTDPPPAPAEEDVVAPAPEDDVDPAPDEDDEAVGVPVLALALVGLGALALLVAVTALVVRRRRTTHTDATTGTGAGPPPTT